MKRILYYTMILLFAFEGVMNAQHTIHGKVTDMDNNPVEGVAVVLQTLDSVYVDAVITDSVGVFNLNQEAGQTYRLLFQHLLFEPFQMEISDADAGTIRLVAKDYELEGIVHLRFRIFRRTGERIS